MQNYAFLIPLSEYTGYLSVTFAVCLHEGATVVGAIPIALVAAGAKYAWAKFHREKVKPAMARVLHL